MLMCERSRAKLLLEVRYFLICSYGEWCWEDIATYPSGTCPAFTRVFQIEGCKRYHEKHYVEVTVNAEQLEAALSRTGITLAEHLPHDWDEVPHLDVDCHALYGQHRIAAAAQFLDPNDQWWAAKVHSDDLPEPNVNELEEEYSNEQAFSDGEIVLRIREYHKASNQDGENRWWARLSPTKRKELRQLLRDKRYAAAIDALLPFRGLWEPVQLGCLHRLLTMKCDKECLQHLEHIAQAWLHILDGLGTSAADVVDHTTVKKLETLAPYHASSDAELVKNMMHQLELFPKVLDQQDRSRLLDNILSMQYMIPSLYTFFEHLKYLEPCARILRGLLPNRCNKSIQAGLAGHYVRPSGIPLEYGPNDRRMHHPRTPSQDRSVAYHQLWLWALRHFPDMTNTTTRKDADSAKPVAKPPNPALWQEFGSLALLSGFRTPAAIELSSQDGCHLLTTAFVDSCPVEETQKATTVTKITDIIRTAKRPKLGLARPPSILTSSALLRPEQRCGRPFESDHVHDSDSLFLPAFCADSDRGENITTLFTKRDLFRNFFDVDSILGMTFDAPPEPQADPYDPPQTTQDECEQCKLREQVLHATNSKIDSYEGKVQDLQKHVSDVQKELSEQRAKCAAVNISLLAKDKTIEALYTQISDHEEGGRCKQDQYESLQRDLKTARNGEMAKDKTIEALRVQVSDHEKDGRSREEKYESLQQQLCNARIDDDEEKSSMHNTIASLKAEVATLETEATLLRHTNSEHDTKVLAQQRLQEQLQQQLTSMTEVNATLSETIATRESDVKSHEAENTHLRETNSREQDILRARIQECEGKTQRLQDQLKEQLQSGERQSRLLMKAAARLEEEMTLKRDLQAKTEEQDLQIETLKDELAESEEQYERAEIDRYDALVVVKNIGRDNEALNSDITKALNDNEALNSDITKALNDNEALNSDITTATERALQLEDLLAHAMTELENTGFISNIPSEVLVQRPDALVLKFVSNDFEIYECYFTQGEAREILKEPSTAILSSFAWFSGEQRKRIPRLEVTAGFLFKLWKHHRCLWLMAKKTVDGFFKTKPAELRLVELEGNIRTAPGDELEVINMRGSDDDTSDSSLALTKKRKRA